MRLKITNILGLSLIEILVVVSIFAILGIIITRSVILTLQGSKKSESLIRVRENLDYAKSVIERQIRNADNAECPNPDTTLLNYTDQFGNKTSFSCTNIGQADSFIASGSGRLTGDQIKITDCSFVCSPGGAGIPASVNFYFTAQDAVGTGAQSSAVTVQDKIFLRNY